MDFIAEVQKKVRKKEKRVKKNTMIPWSLTTKLGVGDGALDGMTFAVYCRGATNDSKWTEAAGNNCDSTQLYTTIYRSFFLFHF